METAILGLCRDYIGVYIGAGSGFRVQGLGLRASALRV